MDDFLGFLTCLLIGLPCGYAMVHASIEALVCRVGSTGLRISVVSLCGSAGALMLWGSLTFLYSYLMR